MRLGYWPKFHKLHIYPLSTPGGEIELLALQAVVSEIWANFQNCHIWAWNLTISQISGSCTYILFLPEGIEIELIFAPQAAVSEIRADFQICHIWVWNMAIAQSARSCTYNLYIPFLSLIQLIFALWAAVSEIRTDFQNCHIWVLALVQSSRSCTQGSH